jgi:arylsulfatase A-like enzyme
VREFQRVAGADTSIYDVEIHYVDAQIGRLMEALKQRGIYDETLIVLTSDHGEGLGEHDWHAHRLLYQEQIHVPLIVKSTGAGGGRVIDDLVRTIDVFPTVLEALGVEGPEVEGRTLSGLMSGATEPPRLAYADQLNRWDSKASMLEQRPADDLLDPDEARNLYTRSGEVARGLIEELNRRDPWVLSPLGEGDEDADALEALRELGYIDGGDE